jgi:peptide chain release factor 2
MSSGDFWNDKEAARTVIERVTLLKSKVNPWLALNGQVSDLQVLMELVEAEAEGPERDATLKEIGEQLEQAESDYETLELRSLLSGPHDGGNAIVTIHAGAGGTESCDWADMLLRMYRRWLERSGYEEELIDIQPGDEAGIKNATFLVKGAYAYGYLYPERGVHRLVRISPFDSQSRRHTSFASVDVLPELSDDIEIEVREEDLRIDTYRSSGAGGQHVNTTDSAVRITHLPTGIVVSCQNERSQHKNRATAMKVLKARLYEHEQEERRASMEKLYGDRGEIAWGNQIRSYVLQPYTMVKDHRTNHEVGNAQSVLDGSIDSFIQAYLNWHERPKHDS